MQIFCSYVHSKTSSDNLRVVVIVNHMSSVNIVVRGTLFILSAYGIYFMKPGAECYNPRSFFGSQPDPNMLEFGERKQELAIIGQNVDREELERMLDACLLTKTELEKGKSFWMKINDPFPSWTETNQDRSESICLSYLTIIISKSS